jgi:Polysaccharide deacetylase
MPRRPHSRNQSARRRSRRTGRRGRLIALGVAAALTVAVLSVVWQANALRIKSSTTPSVGLSHTHPWLTPVVPRNSHLGTHVAAVERLAKFGLPIYCGGTSKPMVALTFDDGPGPYTRLAITKLRKDHMRATFFLVGKSIRAWPRVAELEKAVGAVGDHTLTHPFLPALSQSAMTAEIAGASRCSGTVDSADSLGASYAGIEHHVIAGLRSS